MKTPSRKRTPIVELGRASRETKGAAIFNADGSGGRLNYVTGMADD